MNRGTSGDVRDDRAETDQNLGTERASAELVAEVDVAERHLGRAESKANLLTLLYGGIVVGAAGIIVQLTPPPPSTIPAWAGVTVFGIACGLLIRTVRPSLKTRSGKPYGFVLYASMKEVEQIPAAVKSAHTTLAMSTRLRDASVAAMAKYRWIGRAVDLAWCGAGLLAASVYTPLLFRLLGWPGS